MTAFADGKIEAYLGPTELGAPDDLETVIIDFIGGSKKSLDIAVQEIDNPKIAQAILDARWRGIDVDMFISRTTCAALYRVSPRSGPSPPAAKHRSRRCTGCSGWMTARSSPRTVASWPPCCARTSRCVGTTTRGCSTRSSPCATTGAARGCPRPRCSAARRTSRSLTCTAISTMSSCSTAPTCAASTRSRSSNCDAARSAAERTAACQGSTTWPGFR